MIAGARRSDEPLRLICVVERETTGYWDQRSGTRVATVFEPATSRSRNNFMSELEGDGSITSA
jgi:hypothetical protein